MKCQSVFSGKNKKKPSIRHLLNLSKVLKGDTIRRLSIQLKQSMPCQFCQKVDVEKSGKISSGFCMSELLINDFF